MIITKCKQHPKYDPASGKPGGKLWAVNGKLFERDNPIELTECMPCPYCWQARAKWLKVENTSFKSALSLTNKRIAELEGQLAELEAQRDKANAIIRHDTQLIQNLTEWKQEAEKREAVLREAFTNYRDHVGTCAPLTWASVHSDEYVKLAYEWEQKWGVLDIEARAALVK